MYVLNVSSLSVPDVVNVVVLWQPKLNLDHQNALLTNGNGFRKHQPGHNVQTIRIRKKMS